MDHEVIARAPGRDAAVGSLVLECVGLRKTFGAGVVEARPALAGVDLQAGVGDFVVVIGSNGAGKSTLLNVIAGTVQPDAGGLRIGGRDVAHEPAFRRAGSISRVFQDPMIGTAGSMTIEENLALAEQRGRRRGLALHVAAKSRKRFRLELSKLQLGLEDRLSTQVALLSGGQRQALSLLMAVLSRPRLLLLDEHTASLDPRTAALVMDATMRVVEDNALTALMVTHNMRQAIETGNRLIMMHAGRIRYEVSGREKATLTPSDLVERFKIESDRMLLDG